MVSIFAQCSTEVPTRFQVSPIKTGGQSGCDFLIPFTFFHLSPSAGFQGCVSCPSPLPGRLSGSLVLSWTLCYRRERVLTNCLS